MLSKEPARGPPVACPQDRSSSVELTSRPPPAGAAGMEEGASSPGDGGGMQFQVAVAVRGDGRASRRAARWAAASLVPPGGRVALVHVIPPVSFVPSPCKDHFTSLPLLESSGFQMGAT